MAFIRFDGRSFNRNCWLLSLLLFVAAIFVQMITVGAFAEIITMDRRINWSPGIPGGVPNRATIFCNVKTDFGAVGDGVHDDAPNIQNAINACPVGQVVHIPAGTYRLNSQLTITRGIVLKGASPANTMLKTYAAWHGIQIGNWPSTPVGTNVSGSSAKGDTTLTVASITTPSLSIGDYIVIDQINDGVEVINVDSESRDNGTRCLSQITKITGINGQALTIAPPLYHSYDAAQNPQVWKLNQGIAMTTYAGIEDLYIERISPTGTEGYSNIKMVACAYCWVKNVESKFAQFRHVDLDRSFRCEIRDNYFNDGMHWNTGGFAYGVVCGNRSTDHLIENNIFRHLRHSMVAIEGATGNVFGYNYSLQTYQADGWLAPDLMLHSAHATMNLFEGNYATKADGDHTHGSASYNTFFRNYLTNTTASQTVSNNRYPVSMHDIITYSNFVGNVLGEPGQSWTSYETGATRNTSSKYIYSWGFGSDGDTTRDSTIAQTTTLRHGNYDDYTKSTVWDANLQDHNLINSLYLMVKPSFFGNLSWPSIGADLNPMVGELPAKDRYEGKAPPIAQLSPPTNLRVVE